MTTRLMESVGVLKGVGPKRLVVLHALEIFTIEDLLSYYPRKYVDCAVRLPQEVPHGDTAVFAGTVSSPPVLQRGRGAQKVRVTFGLLVQHANIRVTIFNQPWQMKQLAQGQNLTVRGIYDAPRQQLNGATIIAVPNEGLTPIYPTTQGITDKTLRQLIADAWDYVAHDLPDRVPLALQTRYRLAPRAIYTANLHFPSDQPTIKTARRSAAFEEFFLFQMRLQLIKQMDRRFQGQAWKCDTVEVAAFEKQLPFTLTKAQQKVSREIMGDLGRPIHMNRLLQGDVGSGKTIVAALAMLAVITAGHQAALMAPTEILAQQHAVNLANIFDKSSRPIRVEVLTSGLPVRIRRQLLADLVAGDIDVLVGTHALIQPDVYFHRLALAVIDEQHRFGVNQRALLRQNGENPDILAMTATPIPRTLAITAYGEMDVSIIDELPAGRQKIITRQLSHNQFDDALAFVKQQVQAGGQAYIVTALIEESETLDVQNALALYEELADYFGEGTVGLLHGRLKKDEKATVMADFKAKRYTVLVATTVIEVGVDVPNATTMVILDADRFGLAQLHQLRGRVGRGSRQSYALLVADPKTPYGRERLQALVDTTDGFVLAEKDLQLRGSGDILGVKQSGVPEFRVGDPVHDLKMMEVAQQEAITLLADPQWDKPSERQELVGYLSKTLAKNRHFD